MPAEGTDTVLSATHFALPANVENLALAEVSPDLQGYGNALANTIIGNGGNNLLDGGAGADAHVGGAGNDTYFVDNAGDAVFENAGEGNDSVFATVQLRARRRMWRPWSCRARADLQGYGNGLRQRDLSATAATTCSMAAATPT